MDLLNLLGFRRKGIFLKVTGSIDGNGRIEINSRADPQSREFLPEYEALVRKNLLENYRNSEHGKGHVTKYTILFKG